MRRLFSFALPLALALCSGCFLIADTDDFVEDESCDLALDLRAFTPHVGQTVEVRLTQPLPGATVDDPEPQLRALAVFDPFDRPNMNIQFPNTVPALEDPERKRPTIDFFADFDSSGGYSGQPDDHSWRIEDPCEPGRDPTFTHDFIFDDLQTPRGPGSDIFIDFCPNLVDGGALGPLDPFDGTEPFEVRVTGTFPPSDGVDGMAEQSRAVGFYRLESAATSPMGIRIPDAFDNGIAYKIEVIVDRNDDFAHDGETDQGWTYFFDAADPFPCPPLAEARTCGLRAEEVPACADGPDIRVRLSRGHVPNFSAPTERSWVEIPEGT